MKYREQFAKTTAIKMFAQMSSREAVITMLQQEGAGEKADELGEEYYQDYLFIQSQYKRNSQKSGGMYITIGCVFIAASLAYSLLMYFALDDGSTVILSGLLISGIFSLVKGLLAKRN